MLESAFILGKHRADASIDRASVTTPTWKLCVAILVFPFANSDRFESLSVSIRCEISSHASHVLWPERAVFNSNFRRSAENLRLLSLVP